MEIVSHAVQLRLEIADSPKDFGWITLDGEGGNAFTRPNFADAAELQRFLAQGSLRAAVVRGAGRHFSSGAHPDALKKLKEDPKTHGDLLHKGRSVLEAIAFAPIPVFAMIRGSCLGAGLELALACHGRVASENALLGLPESSLRIMPGLGGVAFAAKRIGRAAAMELAMTGRILSAAEALDMGLVQKVVPTKELEAATVEHLESLISDRPIHVIRGIMQAIAHAERLPFAEALEQETTLFLDVAARTAATEGGCEG